MTTTELPTLVTGAAGKTGRAVIRALLDVGVRVRAFVRDAAQRDRVGALGVRDTLEGDLRDARDLRAAARGARSIYHICPNVHPDEIAIGRTAIAAARAAGMERFVFHSVLHPQAEAMPHHWAKLRVEEALFQSGLDFTILQPAPYMQNVLGQWERAAHDGVYAVPYSPSTRISMVDLNDVALVAAAVLHDPRHVGATYELCAAERLDQQEIAALLGCRLNRAVRAEILTIDSWSRTAGCAPGSYRFDTLTSMFRYYERYGMAGGSGPLEWLLGRPATRFEEFLRQQP